MFRRERRSQPLSGFINWTDYRWEPGAWQSAQPRARHFGGTTPHPRGYTFLQVFLAGLAVVAGVKLMASLRNRGNRSWLERGMLAILLVLAASYISKRNRRR